MYWKDLIVASEPCNLMEDVRFALETLKGKSVCLKSFHLHKSLTRGSAQVYLRDVPGVSESFSLKFARSDSDPFWTLYLFIGPKSEPYEACFSRGGLTGNRRKVSVHLLKVIGTLDFQ